MGVPVPLKHSSASTDLSGLEVHDIEGSAPAPPALSSIVSQKRPRRRLRWRLLRWAGAVAGVLGIMFVALLAQASFINYFPPLAEQDLRLPVEPSPPRVPAMIAPIPIPADVTLQPPLPAAFHFDPRISPIARP